MGGDYILKIVFARFSCLTFVKIIVQYRCNRFVCQAGGLMAVNKYPISLRFDGAQFKTRGVPIQDLGESLVLLQRMVHKAYFIREKQSFKKAVPSSAERRFLAMEIAERKRGSDIYQLAWLARDVADNVTAGALQGISGEIASALMILAANKIWDLIQKRKRQPVDLVAISIFNELEELTNRVGKANGIRRIEIHFAGRRKAVVIDAKMRDAIKDAKKLLKKGSPQTLECDVIAPHTIGQDYAFVRVGNDRIKVHMKRTVFREMMQILGGEPTARLRFQGRPRLMIDFDQSRFAEYYAESVQRV
jgi:hypothetical protein